MCGQFRNLRCLTKLIPNNRADLDRVQTTDEIRTSASDLGTKVAMRAVHRRASESVRRLAAAVLAPSACARSAYAARY